MNSSKVFLILLFSFALAQVVVDVVTRISQRPSYANIRSNIYITVGTQQHSC